MSEQCTETKSLPLAYKVEELIPFLKIGRNTAYELVRSGQIRSVKIGRTYRIPREALEDYLRKTSI